MAGEVFAVNDFAQPFLDHWRTDVVVVNPVLVACVIWRIDVNAFDLAVVVGQKRLEGLQVVAVDNQVVVKAGLIREALGFDELQLVIRHQEVKILHQCLALKI